MALQVWLPLNGNLNNQGLTDITVTNNGATVDNNGKIGKCYYFDGNGHYLQFSKTVGDLYSKDFSYAVWLKPTDDTRSIICSEYSASGASGIAFELSASRGIRLYWNGAPDIYPTNCTLPKNEWSHVAVTRSGNEAKFYINGELRYTYNGTLSNKTSTANIRLGDDYRGGTGVSYMGYMNDFRIYDHALSPKEIEVLSRGLVCHYPLNGGGRGGDNIMPNSYIMNLGTSSAANGVWRLAGTSNMSRSRVQIDDGFYAFENSGIQTANDGSCYGIDSFVFEANTTYTMSMIARITEGTEGYAGFSPSNVTVIGGTHTKYERYYYVTPLTTAWKRIYITFTTGDSTTRNIYIGVTTGSASVTTQMALVKIEKGDKSTPWMPNSADTEYTKMGYDSTTEYDVSGYGNNGIKNNITYDSNTARYSTSSVFDNTQSGRIFTPDFNIGNEWSFGVWVKPPTTARGWESVAILNNTSGDTDTQFGLYIYKNSNYVEFVCNTQTALITSYAFDGNWHHIFGTFDGITFKGYIDGELKITKEITHALLSRTNLGIGGRHSTSDTSFADYYLGNMSDFRIYATALSATQVAELYNTAISVANNGALMGYELVEV